MEREALRRAAKTSLINFTEFTYPRYEPAGLHRQIAEQLERVERGEIDRLMLLVPPRHGKSELASRRFPAWYLGRHPEQHFISASASFALAEDFGRDLRNLMKSEEYQQVFDTRLAEASQARVLVAGLPQLCPASVIASIASTRCRDSQSTRMDR